MFHSQIGNCVMHDLCDKCFSLPCECSHENNSVLTLINHLGNRLEIRICGHCSSAPCNCGKGNVYMFKGLSSNSINNAAKTSKSNATTTCVKRKLMFPTENIAKKLKCTNTNEKYSSENDCTLAHQQLDDHSRQTHISPVASKCIQPKTCECKGLSHNCGISNVKTVKQCLPLAGCDTDRNFTISTKQKMCSNSDNNDIICQQPDADVVQVHISPTHTSDKQACVCTCCHASNLQRHQCVIFISKNYNFFIPAVSTSLSKRHRIRGCKEFICKKCHVLLKSGKMAYKQKCHTNRNEGHTTYSSGKDVTVKILHGNGMQKSDHDAHNDITSLCISQDPSLSNACVCTCCHETNIARTHCIVFKESRYNMTSDDVKQALSCRYHIPTAKEFVCRKCDQFLLKSSMPPHAVSSPTKPVQGMRCLSCCRPPSGKMYFLDQTDYGDHPLAHEIMQKRIGEAKEYVCSQCHHAILGSSLVPCLLCAQKVTKKMLLFLTHKNILPMQQLMLVIVLL